MTKIVLIALLACAVWMYLKRPVRAPQVALDEQEARAILGLGATASADDIRAAHRRLVSAVHPDRGGSADLARRINAARDVLLKR